MKITESRLRKMIRGVIREFTASSSGMGGAKKSGYQSAERKAAQSDYDTKSVEFNTKSKEYDAAVAAKDDSKRYRKATGKGKYTYSGSPIKGGETNPDWISQSTDVLSKLSAKNTASTAKDSAETTLDTQKASDLQKTKTPASQKVQTGGGKAGKKGGGKKGKKKKN